MDKWVKFLYYLAAAGYDVKEMFMVSYKDEEFPWPDDITIPDELSYDFRNCVTLEEFIERKAK